MVEQRGGLGAGTASSTAIHMHYRPSVDITFASVAKAYAGRRWHWSTGMGGRRPRRRATAETSGATVWAQDEQSCVIYGMPRRVVVQDSRIACWR